MAFDYGSDSLGIRNPFRAYGFLNLCRGLIISGLSLYPLFQVVPMLQAGNGTALGWLYTAIGVVLLGSGLTISSRGIADMLRFYVGRSAPSSLATDSSRAAEQQQKAQQEATKYQPTELEQMLMGRKNTTFAEPDGPVAHFVLSLLQKLIFFPPPLRNMAQRFAGAVIDTVIALISFAITAFVCLTGLIGETGELLLPLFSVLLMLYLVLRWRSAVASLQRELYTEIKTENKSKIVRIIVLAILAPAILGFLINKARAVEEFQPMLQWLEPFDLQGLSIVSLLLLTLVLMLAIGATTVWQLTLRSAVIKAHTRVSEFRTNWQENIHPRELFVNIDNIVMANRRYKEIPNRVYQHQMPNLNEQSQSKGDFNGKVMIETQPVPEPLPVSPFYTYLRLWTTFAAQLLLLSGPLLLFYLLFEAETLLNLTEQLKQLPEQSEAYLTSLQALLSELQFLVNMLFVWLICATFGHLLLNNSRILFAELTFNSLIVFLKCEGTYTESKLTTGKGIYDSTASENYVMRASITPWVLCSRLLSSTFADSGKKNLEHQRYILEMDETPEELQAIVSDMRSFLAARETIASIKNQQDLANTEHIHQINQQSRAMPVNNEQGLLQQPEQDVAASQQQLPPKTGPEPG